MESGWARMWRVSNCGRVCNTRGQISYGSSHADGSRRVWIEGSNYYVHRLVAFAHLRLPPTPLHDKVLHLDGDRAHNHVSNLKYGTSAACSEVVAAARKGRVHLNSQKDVFSRAPGEGTWTSHDSVTAAAGARAVSEGTVRRCSSQGRATRCGLEFKYVIDWQEFAKHNSQLTGTRVQF
mmetsp:Transcript_21334/g.39024  ORF Transcript_21334/g.39024 Transcript_21334/m.39024 type:complete len:179 (+) Transcript_21334:104-640(+)